MSPRHTVVLVHGAWHTSRCWDPVVPRLEELGYQVEAIDLPGRDDPVVAGGSGLAEAVELVGSRIQSADAPVTLVAHSMGGMTATQVANDWPDAIAGLVYVTAMVPADGQSVGDLATLTQIADRGVQYEIDAERGITVFPKEYAAESFYTETSADLAEIGSAQLVPESLRMFVDGVRLDDASIGRVRRGYVECTLDCVLPLGAQRALRVAAGVPAITSLETDHSPFYSAPDRLVEAVHVFVGA